MIAGCSTSAAAFLSQVLPAEDDGTHFLIWFWDWLEHYLAEAGAQVPRPMQKRSVTTPDAFEFFTQEKVVVERWPNAWSRKF